ncbi:chemotaxis protein CheB [Natronospirillum operosum]|uniref:protein-glutamate methylesterase n=1 Tax=Natronospirillum operosum TaxID=2759953 RepID=A0A4Z0W1K0_9GAMM|nr:chemotaxis protein CheB [Natronospirillum operosum]TGG90320.1 chemotaxis protein CheB [Natronospirillum operosum]
MTAAPPDQARHPPTVAVLADDLLQQQRLRALLSEAGYDVVISTTPDRLNPALVQSATIGLWLVDADLDHCDPEIRDTLYEARDCPVLFDEAPACERNDTAYRLWERRLLKTIAEALADRTRQPPPTAPEVSRRDLQQLRSSAQRTLTLPEALRQRSPDDNTPLWILAASLGGPAAIKAFLDVLPAGLPCRFLYAQHIDSHFEDQLISSLGRHCALPVQRLQSGSTLPAGTVNVVPVSHSLRVATTGRLHHNEYGWRGPFSPCLDELMQTLAAAFPGRVHAMVFSGMGGDALLGADTLRAANGEVWVQAPDSCIQPAMPEAIRAAGLHTAQGDPVALAQALLHHLQYGAARPEPESTTGDPHDAELEPDPR